MHQFLTKEFWFSSNLPVLQRSDQALFVAFGTMLVLAIAFRIMAAASANEQVRRKFFLRCFSGLLTFALLGAAWSGLRYLVVPYLGIRFVAGLIGLSFLVWLFFLLKYGIFRFPAEQKTWEHDQVKTRYLKAVR